MSKSQDQIVKAAIYPAIGIARVGNSKDEYFIGPETTTPERRITVVLNVYNQFLIDRLNYYGQERRWADNPFWQGRAGAPDRSSRMALVSPADSDRAVGRTAMTMNL